MNFWSRPFGNFKIQISSPSIRHHREWWTFYANAKEINKKQKVNHNYLGNGASINLQMVMFPQNPLGGAVSLFLPLSLSVSLFLLLFHICPPPTLSASDAFFISSDQLSVFFNRLVSSHACDMSFLYSL